MASFAINRKRKQTVKELSDASDAEHFPDATLDLSSGEEEDGPVQESDSDEIDAFPEIDAASDTDEEEEEESPGEDEEDIFPRAKTIISDITGKPKKVYPEIEPDYDSDSSTEDVRAFSMSVRSDRLTD
jgi:ribosome biogenesis protein ERB1